MMIVRLCIMNSYLSNVITLKPRFYFDRKPFLSCRSLLWQSVLKLPIPITMSYWCFTAYKNKSRRYSWNLRDFHCTVYKIFKVFIVFENFFWDTAVYRIHPFLTILHIGYPQFFYNSSSEALPEAILLIFSRIEVLPLLFGLLQLLR